MYKKCENKERTNGEWEEVRVSHKESSLVLKGLWCGSRYQIYIQAYNQIGMGGQSDNVAATTEGGKPGTVSQERLLYVNATSITLYLENWEDGGCPITHFEIEYKRRDDEEWTLGIILKKKKNE